MILSLCVGHFYPAATARDGGGGGAAGLFYRPADWFMCRSDDRDTLRLRTDINGEDLRPFGWIVHKHKAKSGYICRAGLVRVLSWPFMFRNFSARDLAEFLEIYGLPMRLGTYPRGSSDEEKATLMRAVVGIGHAAAGIVPEGMAIEFKDAAKGAASPFVAMMDWAEKSMSKAILGGTLTSQTDDGGAYALGAVHEQVLAHLVRSDLRQYERTLSQQMLRPLALLNTSLTRPPRLVFDIDEPEDLRLYAEAVPALVNAGLAIPVRWVREKLRIPEPEGDEPVLTAAPAPASLRTRLAALSAPTPDIDVVDRQVDMAEADGAGPVADMMAQIRTIVDRATDLSDLVRRLEIAWPDIDDQALADAMGQALAAAHLAGRYDILEGL